MLNPQFPSARAISEPPLPTYDYPSFNATVFYQPIGYFHRPTILSKQEILCGSFFKNTSANGRIKTLNTPNKIYDIAPILSQIPSHQSPELLLVRTDAAGLNFPVNLKVAKCPKILLIGDTHHMYKPLRTLIDYAHHEPFDIIILEHVYRHFHFFKESGLKNLFWLPNFSIYPHIQAPKSEHSHPLSFVGQVGKYHPYRRYMLQQVIAAGFPLQIFQTSQPKAAEIYANSQINLNVSLNDDINLRNLEVLASGGFLLTDNLRHQSGFHHLFEDGKHLVTYQNKDDLEDKIKYFLHNPAAAFDIAKAGHQLFLDKHRPELKVKELLNFINQQTPHPIYQHPIDRRSSYQHPKQQSQPAYRHRLSIHEYIQEKHRVIPKTVGIFDPNTPPELMGDAADLSRLTLYWLQDIGHSPNESLLQSRQILENRDVLQYIQPIDAKRLTHELNQLEPGTFRFAIFNIETTALPEIQELSRRFQLNAFILVKNGCERLSPDEQAQLQPILQAHSFSQDSQDPVVYRTQPASQPMPSLQQPQPLSPQDLTQLFQTYQQTPNDPNSRNQLRQLRRQLTQQWLNLPNDQLETHFNSQLGQLHKALWQSGLKNEPRSPEDRQTIAQLSQTLSQGLQTPGALQALLCATLYGYPHQFNIQYQNAPIPNWMTELYLTYLFESPRLFQDLGEVNQYHHYFHNWTQYLQQKLQQQPNSPPSQLLAKAFANLANLTPLCFSDQDQRALQQTRAAILEQYLEHQGCQLDHHFPPRPENRPIRFGILCLNYLPSAETFTTIPAFEHLDRRQFQIHLYALQQTGHPHEDYCRQRADHFTVLPADNLSAMAQRVRQDDLDVLLIGTNITARSYPLTLLSLHRLARIQSTGLSAPTTTGMRNLDLYIGGSLTATDPSQYSERLLTIEGSGLCFQFPPDHDQPSINLNRADWGLPPDTTVFISGANFRKINPELRETWAKLLARLPNSILVLYPFGPNWGRHPQLETPFFQQMQQALQRHNVDPQRLLLIKTLPNRADLYLALQQADIYLDSFPYSGAASVLDPLRVGLPIVAREGSELRFRQSAALLRELGLPDLIAQSDDHYLDLAVQLAQNPQWRQAKQQQLQTAMAQTPPFLDSRAFSQKIGQLLQDLVQGDRPPSNDDHPSSQAFINRTIGCCNIYYIDPTEQPIIEELRQLRRQLVDHWLSLPSDQLPLAYNGEIGKAFKAILKSNLQREPLTPEEQQYRQQLTEQGAGLNQPQALNALMGAMLYYPADEMKVRDAQTRLPDWLYPDYAAVFETEPTSDPDPIPAPPAPQTPIMGTTAPPESISPGLLQNLQEVLNQYQANPSNPDIILKLRNLRHQLILTLASQPLEQVAVEYQGDLGRVYKQLLRSGFQKQPLADIEVQTRDKLAEAWKNRHHQDVNAMMGLFLYFPPGTLKIQDPLNRLPDWLYGDYQAVFEAALPPDGATQPVSSQSSPPPATTTPTAPLPDYPVASANFLNRLLGTVNLYQIDPNDATVISELQQIRRQFVDHWLTLPQGELERIYYEDLGRGYRILLTSGFQKQSLTPEEQAYRQELTQKGAGLTEPQSLNALMGAMLYYPTDQLRVQDAATRLPAWLLPDYEAVFEGKVQQQPSVQPPSPEFGQQVATLMERLQANPQDGAALLLLRQARQQLCQYWLSLPAEQLSAAYAGPMGEVQRRLMTCGLRGLARTAAEQSLFEQLRGELSQGMNRPKSLQCFLAAMLLCPSDQLRLSSAHGLLPSWLIGDYERVFLVKG